MAYRKLIKTPSMIRPIHFSFLLTRVGNIRRFPFVKFNDPFLLRCVSSAEIFATRSFSNNASASNNSSDSKLKNNSKINTNENSTLENRNKTEEIPFKYVDCFLYLDSVMKSSKEKEFSSLKKLLPSNFEACITVCSRIENFELIKSLLSNEEVYGTFGLHPSYSMDWSLKTEEKLREMISHPKVVAFGEIGLDYFKRRSILENQRKVFAKQLEIALTTNKPILIHCRDAEEDMFRILSTHIKNKAYPIHIKCSLYTSNFVEKLLNEFSNIYFGASPLVHLYPYRTRDIQMVPLTKLLFESCAPFVPGLTHSGSILKVADQLCKLRKISHEELYTQVRQNTKNLYGF